MSRFPDFLSAEFRALCSVVGCALCPDRSPAEMYAALNQVKSWHDFVWGANRHRLLAMILPVLARLPDAPIPPEVMAQLNALYQQQVMRGMAYMAELSRVLRLLAHADIAVMPLKGLVLAQQLYGSPFHRGIGDFDLFINPSDFSKAHQVLLQAGYLRRDGLSHKPGGDRLLPLTKDVTYQNGQGYIIELHVALSEVHGGPEWAFSRLWDQRVPLELGQLTVYRMPSSETALYLLTHGAEHCWNRLCWVMDVVVLLQDPTIREATLSLCRQRGHQRSLGHLTSLSEAWFGISIENAPPALPAAREEWFQRTFFAGQNWLKRPQRGEWAWIVRQIHQQVWRSYQSGSVRYVARALRRLLWNPMDQQTLALPPGFSFLYPLLRPLTWIMRNYGIFKKKR